MQTTPKNRALRVLIAAALIPVLALASALSPAFGNQEEDADALYAAQQWGKAAVAYEALLQEDATNAKAWFNLGRARHHLKDYAGACDAYRRALDAGYARPPQARYHLARALMSLGKREEALRELEEIAKTGGPPFRTVRDTEEFAALAGDPRFEAVLDALNPCNTEEHRQFDFWLGEWDVTPAGATAPVAVNNISSVQDGCVVFEQYAAGGFTGMSINFYDPALKAWRQTWMSNGGGAVYLQGGLNADGAMEMTDKDLPVSAATGVVNKVTWTPKPDGGVRQFWQSSKDGGKTWAVVFDGLYTKKKPASEKD